MLGVPYKFSDTPAQIDKAPPLLGEDNNDVLSSLGYDEEYKRTLHKERYLKSNFMIDKTSTVQDYNKE